MTTGEDVTTVPVPYGHLFIVHSRLETISSTAVVIPSDSAFSVNVKWKAAAGIAESTSWASLKPADWGPGAIRALRTDRAAGDRHPQAWIIDSIGPTPEAVGKIATRAIETIVMANGPDLQFAAQRAGLLLPLIALPMVGAGRGGHDHNRARLAETLIDSLSEVAARLSVDIALVTASRSDYSVLQQLRRTKATRQPLTVQLSPALLAKARSLGARVANNEVALFFGAGLSMGAGLPGWPDLLRQLLADLDTDLTWAEVAKLPVLDQGELIEAEIYEAIKTRGGQELGERVADAIRGVARPGLGHVLLAGMQIANAVTTNYDQLYERAVEATGGVGDDAEISTLPWNVVTSEGPWILKMHGDIDHPKSIVLTRGSFVHYDTRWKPVGAVVQSLMMTKHLLVVGASLTDDNLIRFAHEVALLRAQLAADGGAYLDKADIGTVITLKPDRAFERLWGKQFDVVVAGETPRDTGDSHRESARSLTVFLDFLAMYAERQAGHLLDARYQVEAPAIVDVLRDAYQEAFHRGRTDDAWASLARTLGQFGAAEGETRRKPVAHYRTPTATTGRSRPSDEVRTAQKVWSRARDVVHTWLLNTLNGTDPLVRRSLVFTGGRAHWTKSDRRDEVLIEIHLADQTLSGDVTERLKNLGWEPARSRSQAFWVLADKNPNSSVMSVAAATDLLLKSALALGTPAKSLMEGIEDEECNPFPLSGENENENDRTSESVNDYFDEENSVDQQASLLVRRLFHETTAAENLIGGMTRVSPSSFTPDGLRRELGDLGVESEIAIRLCHAPELASRLRDRLVLDGFSGGEWVITTGPCLDGLESLDLTPNGGEWETWTGDELYTAVSQIQWAALAAWYQIANP